MEAKVLSFTMFSFIRRFTFYKRLALALLAASLLVSSLTLWNVSQRRSEGLPYGVYSDPEHGWVMADFQAHLQFVRALLSNPSATPYSAENHRYVIDQWTQGQAASALPFGYSPTRWLTLAPFTFLPDPTAYVCWAGLAVLAAHAVLFFLILRADNSRALIQAFMLQSVLLSFAYLGAVALGQTALWSTLLFAALGRSPVEKKSLLAETYSTLGIWILTVKPPLALVAGAGFLAARHYKPVVFAMLLTLVETALLTSWIGFQWMPDYFHLITHYDVETCDAYFRGSLVPERMSNLRYILHICLDWKDSQASSTSNLAWILASVSAVVWCWRKTPATPPVPMAINLLLLFYCLFAQHLSFTEDLALCLPVSLVFQRASIALSCWAWGLLLFVLTANALTTFPHVMAWAFAAKAVLAWIYCKTVICSTPPLQTA